jgi:hypothetical protein
MAAFGLSFFSSPLLANAGFWKIAVCLNPGLKPGTIRQPPTTGSKKIVDPDLQDQGKQPFLWY